MMNRGMPNMVLFPEDVNVAIAQLPERERLFVELYYFRGLKYSEIAATLCDGGKSISPATHVCGGHKNLFQIKQKKFCHGRANSTR